MAESEIRRPDGGSGGGGGIEEELLGEMVAELVSRSSPAKRSEGSRWWRASFAWNDGRHSLITRKAREWWAADTPACCCCCRRPDIGSDGIERES